MSDPITRTVVEFRPLDSISQVVERLLDPDQQQAVVMRREEAVKWCEVHKSPWRGIGCYEAEIIFLMGDVEDDPTDDCRPDPEPKHWKETG